MPDAPNTSAADRWFICFVIGFVLLLSACITSRYARPDWTGGVVALLVVAGGASMFAAGWFAAKEV